MKKRGPYKRRDAYERFLTYCRPCEETGCIEWAGAFNGRDRKVGEFNLHGVTTAAPRAAWILHGRPIPKGHWVYRRCYNLKCVNVEHLATGTRAKVAAYLAKGGRLKGDPRMAVLTRRINLARAIPEPVVRQIQQLLEAGDLTRSAIAKAAGVSRDTVTKVKHGRHIHSPERAPLVRGASVFALAEVVS